MDHRSLLLLMLPLLVAGTEPAPRPMSIAMLAPPPPSSFAFCRQHGGDCDPIPPATAMPDGKPVSPPPAWLGYCRRTPLDPACRR